MRRILPFFVCVVLLLLCCIAPGTAQDAKKAGVVEGWDELQVPDKPTADEIKQARETLKSLSPAELMTIHGLRFLLRPDWTWDVFPHQPMDYTLKPWGVPGKGALDDAELLRLFALLSCGYPADDTLKSTVARFMDSKPGETRLEVTWLAVECLVAWQLVGREDLVKKRKASRRLRDSLRAVAAQNKAFDKKTLNTVLDNSLFWRASAMQIARQAHISVDTRLPDALVDGALERNYRSSSYRGTKMYVGYCLGSAIALDCMPKDTRTKNRLWADFKENQIATLKNLADLKGACLTPAWTAVLPLVPREILTAAGWTDKEIDGNFQSRVKYDHCADGSVPENGMLGSWLGMYPYNGVTGLGATQLPGRRSQLRLAETALAFAGANGGMTPAPGTHRVLEGMNPKRLNKLMRAATVVAAGEFNARTTEIKKQVPGAIRKGCEYLVSTQDERGVFGDPQNKMNAQGSNLAYQSLCLLTLLHGGYGRDSRPIKKGLAVLEGSMNEVARGRTYADSLLLQFFQRYYLEEERKCGTLDAANRREYNAACSRLEKLIPDIHALLIDTAAHALETAWNGEKFGWCYLGSVKPTTRVRKHGYARSGGQASGGARSQGNYGDNSNSQYGILGLWCASVLGIQPDKRMVKQELDRWINLYVKDDTMPEVPDRLPTRKTESRPHSAQHSTDSGDTVQPGGWPYLNPGSTLPGGRSNQVATQVGKPSLNMTTAGATGLQICMLMLRQQDALSSKQEAAAKSLLVGACAWLAERLIDGKRWGGFNEARSGGGRLEGYGLYGTERMGMLSGVRVLQGNEDWYRSGADLLLRWQDKDGSWVKPVGDADAKPDLLDTCFAVLFLKRDNPCTKLPPSSGGPITGHRKYEGAGAK